MKQVPKIKDIVQHMADGWNAFLILTSDQGDVEQHDFY